MVAPIRLSADQIVRSARSASLADDFGPLLIADSPVDRAVLGAEPCIVLGVDVLTIEQTTTQTTTPAPAQAQANAPDSIIRAITETLNQMPTASIAATVLLRSTAAMTDVDARLVLESTTYSTLQSGPEFLRWRAARPVKPVLTADDEPAVVFNRVRGTLHIQLNRPKHGNAVNRALRDGLCEAALLGLVDDAITTVVLGGNGNHFCTGGDLDEFGSFTSPDEAHLIRLQRSPARFLARLSDRLTVHMHGNCAGSGVELAAFAHHVMADPATTFRLPETALGLVPGAGGTVSIVDRIGPQRTLQLLLTGERIDAPTALAWGLIDEIAPRGAISDR